MVAQRFVGWVPTSLGRLSFRLAGLSHHPTRAVRANVSDQSSRYLICYQRRPRLDSALPLRRLLAPLLVSLESDLWFACVARCSNRANDPESPLEGRLYIFARKLLWRRHAELLVREAQANLRTYETLFAHTGLDTYFSARHETLLRRVAEESTAYVDFSLSRQGVARLSLPKDRGFCYHPIDWPENENERRQIERLMSSQLFFFLKDIIHTHQHHDPDLDTITDLHEDDGTSEWRYRTLQSLYLKLIDMRRTRRTDLSFSSLGILSYARAFRIQADKEDKDNVTGTIFSIDDTPLEESIRAAHENAMLAEQKRTTQQERIQSIAFSIVGTLIAGAGLLQLTGYKVPTENVAPPLKALADWVIWKPDVVFGAVACAVLYPLTVPHLIKRMYWAARLVQTLPKAIAGFILVGSSTVLLAILFYLVQFTHFLSPPTP